MKQLFIVVFSCILVACATPGDEFDRPPEPRVSAGSDCISEGTIRGYRVLDDSNLIVTAGARRKYHVALAHRAFNLRSSWQIGFVSPLSRICPGTGELVVSDGFRPETIRIHSIRQLTPEEHDALLVAYGKKEPIAEQAPESTPVDSAEVEELD